MNRSSRPKAEFERWCDSYFKLAYRSVSVGKFRTFYFWLSLAFAVICAASLYVFFRDIPPPGASIYSNLWFLAVIASWALFLVTQDRAKEASRMNTARLIGLRLGFEVKGYDEARKALLSNTFCVNSDSFIEIAKSLKDLSQLKALSNSDLDSSWLAMLRYVYDPASKPRLLALMALSVAVCIAFVRQSEFGSDEFFSIVQDGYFSFVVVVTVVVAILLFMLSRFWMLLELGVIAIDKRGAPNSVLIKTIEDLVAFSTVPRKYGVHTAAE